MTEPTKPDIMERYIKDLEESESGYIKLREPDSGKRALMHEAMKSPQYNQYSLHTIYTSGQILVRCDTCGQWLDNHHNGCCDDCNSTYRKALCTTCDDYTCFYLDEIGDPLVTSKPITKRLWHSTEYMLLRKAGTPFKHLLAKDESIRKKYKNNTPQKA